MNEKTKSSAGAHSLLKGLESGLGGGLGNLLHNLSNRCGSRWWGSGGGGGKKMIWGSGVGKLGTYCLKVLMVIETSLLTCLGPREARIVDPSCQAVSRLGGWESSGIPSSGETFLPSPTKGFCPGPWAGFLIHETDPRKLKGELGNAVPRLCASSRRGLGDVSSVLSKRALWPSKFRKSIPRLPCRGAVHAST